MKSVSSFVEIMNDLKKKGKISNMKEFSILTGNSYSYLSELANERKPLSSNFVSSINEKLGTNYTLVDVVPQTNAFANAVLHFGQLSIDASVLRQIPMFSNADIALKNTSKAMHPLIEKSDWVVCRKITNNRDVVFNELYAFITTSLDLLIRYVISSDENTVAICIAPGCDNPQSLDIGKILKSYKVVGILRTL
jgi:hypothetical protein